MKLIPMLCVFAIATALATSATAQSQISRGSRDKDKASKPAPVSRTNPPSAQPREQAPSNRASTTTPTRPVANESASRTSRDNRSNRDNRDNRESRDNRDYRDVRSPNSDQGGFTSRRNGRETASQPSTTQRDSGVSRYRETRNDSPRQVITPTKPESTFRDGGFGGQTGISRRNEPRASEQRWNGNTTSQSNNRFNGRTVTPVRIEPIPTPRDDYRVAQSSLRQPQARPNYDAVYSRGWRDGYFQYRNNWRDSYFCYPHYAYTYTTGYCPSPWYYYSNLPAYVDPYRCLNTVSINFGWGLGIRYSWNQARNDVWVDYRPRTVRYYEQPVGYGDYDLDRAVSSVSDGFRNRDLSRFDDLLPRGTTVYVDLGDRPGYSLTSDDFYQMLSDVINATSTTSYSIADVWQNGNDATIVADHRFTDAWGQSVVQRHWYGLRRDRYGFRIVSFRSTPR